MMKLQLSSSTRLVSDRHGYRIASLAEVKWRYRGHYSRLRDALKHLPQVIPEDAEAIAAAARLLNQWNGAQEALRYAAALFNHIEPKQIRETLPVGDCFRIVCNTGRFATKAKIGGKWHGVAYGFTTIEQVTLSAQETLLRFSSTASIGEFVFMAEQITATIVEAIQGRWSVTDTTLQAAA